MIFLAAKESSVNFQNRFRKYLSSKGISSKILLLQPFDQFHAKNIDCLSFKGFKDLHQTYAVKEDHVLQALLSAYLLPEDFKKLKHTQWLNSDLERIQFDNVNYHDCLVYLATVSAYYVNHLERHGAQIVFDTDNDNFVRRLLFRICATRGIKYYLLQHSRFEDKVLIVEQQSNGFLRKPSTMPTVFNELNIDKVRGRFAEKISYVNSDDKIISNRFAKKYVRILTYLIGQLVFTTRLQLFYLTDYNFKKLKSHIHPRFFDTWRFNIAILKKFAFRRRYTCGTRPTKPYLYIPLGFTTEGMDSFASGGFASEKEFIPLIRKLCDTAGIQIYIRDHPHMVMERSFEDERFMSHYADYYENSAASLVSESNKILQNAVAVITLNGTTSVEAKILGVPAFTIGRSLHDFAAPIVANNSAEGIDDLECKLTQFLRDPQQSLFVQEYQIKKYLSYVLTQGISYNYVSVIRGETEENEQQLFQLIIKTLKHG